MKLKNGHIEQIEMMLTKDVNLTVRESRLRSRFLRKLIKQYNEVYLPERIEILQSYALRDENNKVIGNGTKFTINKDKLHECNEELSYLAESYFELDVKETELDMFETIYKIITDESFVVQGEVSLLHDELCEKLEDILKEYNLLRG